MHARSAVFDLYGDHLLRRGGWAPVASVVRLLTASGIASAATRTAISRMTREGWLEPMEFDGARGYRSTERADRRLKRTYSRVYATDPPPWDGRWEIVVVARITDRAERNRVSASMEFLGYARMGADAWVAAHPSVELTDLLAGHDHHRFTDAITTDPAALAAQLWDLDTLAQRHERFTGWANDLVSIDTAPGTDEQAYACRTQLVHEWRKFLFNDPGLPLDVLPHDWAGIDSTRAFAAGCELLDPPANRFVDQMLAANSSSHSPERITQ